MPKRVFDMETHGLTGTAVHTVLHDEIITTIEAPKYESDVDPRFLTDDEWRWAVAMRKVLGVGPNWYENAVPMRRRQIEQHYQSLTGHDTSKGRRARQIVASYVEYKLGDRKPGR